MLTLILGLFLFFAIHLVPTNPELRAGLVGRLGEARYKLVFVLVAIAGLAVIAVAFAKLHAMPGKNPVLWYPPAWTRHVAFTLMLPAFILLTAAYIPSRIRNAVGHPMLLAVMLWAVAHLVANGDLAALLVAASFLTWAVYDLISAKRRQALGPLGKAQPGSLLNDIAVVLIGTALYAIMLLWGHAALIGVPITSISPGRFL